MHDLASRLSLRQFRLVAAIQEHGQLAIAAERLSMTQPAASRMLASIEETIGSPIFKRHPKGMTTTPIGEMLASNAISLLNGLERTNREVEAMASGRSGTVRIGAVTGAAVAFVVPAIRELKQGAPDSDILIDVAPSDVLIPDLIEGAYDFVLSRIPPGVDMRQFRINRGRVEDIRFAVRKDHPLTGEPGLTFHDLSPFDWVMQPPGTPLRRGIEEIFAYNRVPMPKNIINTSSLLAMIAYLAGSDAISPMSREVSELIGPKGIGNVIIELDVADSLILTPYHLVTTNNIILNPLAQRLHDLVLDALNAPNLV